MLKRLEFLLLSEAFLFLHYYHSMWMSMIKFDARLVRGVTNDDVVYSNGRSRSSELHLLRPLGSCSTDPFPSEKIYSVPFLGAF